MAGNQSAGFDLVMTFSEEPLRDIFGVAFDTSDLLCTILDATLNQLPGVSIPCDGFEISVSLDRPTDVGLSTSQTDAVDIELSHTIGLLSWRIRMVVGVSVDRSASDWDVAVLDFHDRLYHLEAHLGLLPLNVATLRTHLRDTLRQIPLLPVVVDRGTTDEGRIKRLDARVVDQTGAGENALAYCLTFGTGTPGNLAALNDSAIGEGDTGTLMVGFDWILRQMEEPIELSMHLPSDAYEHGHLTRSVVIDQDENVRLTNLDFTLDDGFIQVSARIEKSGFCYSASATVGGRFKLEVVDGQLHVDADITDPDLDLDVPWYCWIGAVFLGGLLGGILGAIVVPVILHLVTSTIEGVLDRLADQIVDALNTLNPEASLPAVGFSLVFQRAFIDDVGIGFRAKVRDTAPIRVEGDVRLSRGQVLDLDSGRVGPTGSDGADLAWRGSGDERRLEALCSTRIGETGSRRFDELARYTTYGLDYEQGRALSVHELGHVQDLGIPWVDAEIFVPSLEVFAIRTNERRHALVQVLDVDEQSVRLRFRTFGMKDGSVRIRGGFSCDPVVLPAPVAAHSKGVEVAFEPPKAAIDLGRLVARLPSSNRSSEERHASHEPSAPRIALANHPKAVVAVGTDAQRTSSVLSKLTELRSIERTTGTPFALRIDSPGVTSLASAAEALALVDPRRPSMTSSIGRWRASVEVATRPMGRFDALVDGLGTPRAVSWWVDDVLLDPSVSSTQIDDVRFDHTQNGLRLTLAPRADRALVFELRVAVDDENGKRFTHAVCVDYRPTCKRSVRAIPEWTAFRGLSAVPR